MKQLLIGDTIRLYCIIVLFLLLYYLFYCIILLFSEKYISMICNAIKANYIVL